MNISTIAYEEKLINTNKTTSYIIKSTGEIIRKCNDSVKTFNNATESDFAEFETELISFIEAADHTEYFIDDIATKILISYTNGTTQIVERGLVLNNSYLDTIIQDYIDDFTD